MSLLTAYLPTNCSLPNFLDIMPSLHVYQRRNGNSSKSCYQTSWSCLASSI